jgi:heterodisulfide reductase subunit B
MDVQLLVLDTQKTYWVMHWIQDCYHIGEESDHTQFDEQELAKALNGAQIRKSDLNLVDINSTSAADLGKFKDKQKWLEW